MNKTSLDLVDTLDMRLQGIAIVKFFHNARLLFPFLIRELSSKALILEGYDK